MAWLLGACLLLLVGLFLWFDNPTVNVSASDLGDSGPAGEVGSGVLALLMLSVGVIVAVRSMRPVSTTWL